MEEGNKFLKLFTIRKPLIGMIHLAGANREEKVKKAVEELAIYEEEGVDGAIIEDYHGTPKDVFEALAQSSKQKFRIIMGINVLRDPYSAFELSSRFDAGFIQFDSVQTQDLDLGKYTQLREKYPNVVVLGGVSFKYTSPTGNPLEVDLREGKSRCDAIVTTGSGTGVETPIEKLREFKSLLGKFPLIVGSGVNLENVCEQLRIADGAIVGSYFKPSEDTCLPIDRKRVRDLMAAIKEIRAQ